MNQGKKIGICGRTGSGKSSLVKSLLRLLDIESGDIFIDNKNTQSISLYHVRNAFAVIPQTPLLFSGTVRHNLDPFSYYTDEKIWEALEIVQMKHTIEKNNKGLFLEMQEFGSSFSVGESQLLCVARALLKPSKILLVDEATANIDLKTDLIIQNVLKTKFSDHTVLIIAHRLQTILDCNKILVLDYGNVEQFDTPENLKKDKDGIFYKLLKDSNLVKNEESH